jgi:hypothetical protein
VPGTAQRFALSFVAPVVVTSMLGALVLGGVACGSSKGPNAGNADDWQGERRDTAITHEACDPAGKEAKTFRGDAQLSSGKSFVTRVYEGGREVCSFADLNGDGNVDVYTYFAADGRIRRREAAYTVGRTIDEIAIYEGGELQLVARETNFDGKLDTWDLYEGGKLVRRERDKTGDGRIDEWWTFEPGTENATVVQADPRTGRPDPAQTIKLGVGGPAAPVARPDAGAPEAAAAEPAPMPEPSLADAGQGTQADAPTDAKTSAKGAR